MKIINLLALATVFVVMVVSNVNGQVVRKGNINNSGALVSSGTGVVYIDCSGLPSTYTPSELAAAKHLSVGQLKKHGVNDRPSINDKVSMRFVVSKNNINASGTEEAGATMSWRDASGYANADLSDLSAPSTSGACYNYEYPAGSGKGKWRLPNQKELRIIYAHHGELEAAMGSPNSFLDGGTDQNPTPYMSITTGVNTVFYIFFNKPVHPYTITIDRLLRVRCIRDL